jgi:hypothetical protein
MRNRIMRNRSLEAFTAAMALIIIPVMASASSLTATTSGNWTNEATWGGTVPQVGDDATINNGVTVTVDASTAPLNSLTNNGTLVFSGWNTVVTSTTVTVNGTVTHLANTDSNGGDGWTPDQRVWIACANLTVAAAGIINVNSMGYPGRPSGSSSSGCGPGGSPAFNFAGGAGYGGKGGTSGNTPPNPGGVTYGDPTQPQDPGSGAGGNNANQGSSGAGGGVVRIQATGNVTVNGTISANGGDGGLNHGPGGSGGSIYITCLTFAGTDGTICADGGKGPDFGGSGGGGRIAVVYDTSAQAGVSPQPNVLFAARDRTGVLGEATRSEPGTVYVSDGCFFPTKLVKADCMGMIDPASDWRLTQLTVSNVWFGFVGATVTVSNNFNVISAGRFDLRGNSSLHVMGNATASGASSELRVFSGPTNGISPDYGTLVTVDSALVAASGGWVRSYSDSTNGGSPLFRVQNLTIADASSGFEADGKGYAGQQFGPGYGPGGSPEAMFAGGGGYGGMGGKSASSSTGGLAYGSAEIPMDPGSGSGGQQVNQGYGGNGGGLIRVEAYESITLNGTLSARGEDGHGNQGGAGSGGGIYLQCDTFTGSGALRVNGGNGHSSGGGGGGGRLAVWRITDTFSGTSSANGGTGYNPGTNGTIYWGASPATTPTIDNDSGALDVLMNSATLRGNLRGTGGQSTEVYVFWGTSDGGTVQDAWSYTNYLGVRGAGAVSANVTGLSANTPYYYRFFATNASGAVWADSTTNFTTLNVVSYRLDVTVLGGGDVDMTSGWFPSGTNVLVNAMPGTNWKFASWSGDTNGCSFPGGSSISVYMDRSRQIVANFGAISAVGLNCGHATINYNPMYVYDLAGAVVAQTNWNNILIGGSDGSAGSFLDNIGNASGITVTWSGFEGNWAARTLFINGDEKMMWAYAENHNTGNSNATITVTNIAATSYDVYVYFGSDADGRQGLVGIDGVSAKSFLTYSSTHPFPSSYTVATSIPGDAVTNSANYAVWTNMTASGFNITYTSVANNSGINGIQLVLHTVPPPPATIATNGVPISWLVSYYGVTNDYDALALSDSDGDGAPAWKEYWAGTDPANPQSVLKMLSVDKSGEDVDISWSSVTGEVYNVYRSTDLTAAWPADSLTNNMPADLSGTNQFTDVDAMTNGSAFYRVDVQKLN